MARGAGRCNHQNGTLVEVCPALHFRDVYDGVMEEEGVNELDPITGYRYRCRDCGKQWKFVASPRQQWLRKIYDQLRNAT